MHLERAGLPATFFIPTAYPDAGRLFWWDRVAITMRRCKLERIELAYPGRLVLAPTRDPNAAAKLVCRAMKRTKGVELNRALEELDLVDRRPDPADRRTQVLSASAAGRERLARIRADAEQRLDAALHGWSDDDLLALRSLLERLHHDLQRVDRDCT